MGIWGNPAATKNFFYSSWGGGAPAPGAPPAYATGLNAHSRGCVRFAERRNLRLSSPRLLENEPNYLVPGPRPVLHNPFIKRAV